MTFVIFGDLHINKHFYPSYVWYDGDWYYEGIKRYVLDIIHKYKGKEGIICFLGDLHEYNKKEDAYYSKFYELVKILKKKGWTVLVVLGNHDSGNSYKLYNCHVTQCVTDALYVYEASVIYNDHEISIIGLPYTSRTNIGKQIYDIYRQNKLMHKTNVIVLSHNNIYTHDYFYDKPMFNFNLIKNYFPNITLINGHIHRFYAERQYYQIGSTNPTSFKEYLNAVGCVVYSTDENEFKLYKNTHLLFASLNSTNYVEEMHRFLRQAEEKNAMIYLGIKKDLLDVEKEFREYKCIVGIENLSFTGGKFF